MPVLYWKFILLSGYSAVSVSLVQSKSLYHPDGLGWSNVKIHEIILGWQLDNLIFIKLNVSYWSYMTFIC